MIPLLSRPSVKTPGYYQGIDRESVGRDLPAGNSVGLPLFRDLAHDLSGPVERMLRPVVFADRAWGRGSFRGGLLLRLRDSRHALALLLENEKAGQEECDQDYDNGSHTLNHSRPRDKGTLPRGGADGR